jgi:hypothetical protein
LRQKFPHSFFCVEYFTTTKTIYSVYPAVAQTRHSLSTTIFLTISVKLLYHRTLGPIPESKKVSPTDRSNQVSR